MDRAGLRDGLTGRTGLAILIGLAVTAARMLAGAAGGLPRPLWFAGLDLAVTIPTLGLGLPVLAQALQARRAQMVALRLGGRGWACHAAGETFGLANPWVPGVLVASARGTVWHPLAPMPGVTLFPLFPGRPITRSSGPSTWAELDVEAHRGRVSLRVRPTALVAVSSSLAH